MSWIATAVVITGVSAGIGAYSAYEQGKQAEKMAEYNAAVEHNNALQAQMEAQVAAKTKRKEAEAMNKRQRALYAKAGVVNEGTPLEVLAETAMDMELEALEIERFGKVTAQKHRDQAAIDIYSGKSAKRAGTLNAGETLLSGLGSMAKMNTKPTVKSGGNPGIFCWVAREVYPDDRWMDFRLWLFTQAPEWLFETYGKHGEAFAQWIKPHGNLKKIIRKAMDLAVGG